MVRRHVAFVDRDRRLDTEIRSLADALRDGAVGRTLGGATGEAYVHV
jgi:hypothetical protein